ncbi:hypothetical protein B0H66DRAFT_146394 [Apodospora peruviana]|uniref:RNase T2-like C-terminal domain-containing protein n=1 Tax=Apodospora peruviana TaxID=516989 RepID=A0AAE0MB38_9PEZI|nr:hypothetical protein B0H66DRAFT_146394 [Apodospora peruviana]
MVSLKYLLGFATLASAARKLSIFRGTGQIRTLWNDGNHDDLGCLTDTGLWTSDETLCGVFEAARHNISPSKLTAFTLTSAAGPCQLHGARFTCEPGNEAYEFGTWPWPNSVPGVECLRWGQYGLMASFGRNPPSPADPPQEIHMVSSIEEGKYVWLAWAEL